MEIYTNSIGDGSLRDKIIAVPVFIVLASKNYVEDLDKDSKIIESLQICKELQKDTIVLIDKIVSGENTDILKEHITGLKIVREEVCDFKDVKALSRVFNLVGSRGREFPFCEGGDESYPLQLSDTPKHLYGCSDI